LHNSGIGRKIHELAREANVQVVLTTHSPAFVDLLNVPGLVLVRRGDEGTIATQLGADELAQFCREHGAPAATADSVLPFYSVAATQEILSSFFARKVVLVEGPTEAIALPTYLHRLGLDVAREGIAVISVQGVGNLAKWLRLFAAYGLPTYVIFDNDYTDDADAARRADLLNTLSVEAAHREASRLALTAPCYPVRLGVGACVTAEPRVRLGLPRPYGTSRDSR
jgi:putative ATP-dependent endonuclease of the OLD family